MQITPYKASEATQCEFNLKMYPVSSNKSVAMTDSCSAIIGQCITNIKYKDIVYNNVTLLVLQNLCTEMIFGQDILTLHSKLLLH